MWGKRITATVIVASLGYFVDIYDLVLFSIVRVTSLKSLGIGEDRLLEYGVYLLNTQMFGMLLGGVLWGILGDKRGRLSVLFGSIFLYSIANIANSFVSSISAYGVWRFLAGVGLAGELGAAITLVSEIMSKEKRGYGTAIVAAVGICGAVAAALIGDAFSWQTAYRVGGGLGLLLLILRIGIYESGMYQASRLNKEVRRGDLRMLLGSRERLIRYLSCILIGMPIWYVVGILLTFSPEIARELGVQGPVAAGKSIMYGYIGLAIGDIASGFSSQWLRSRKKVLLVFLALTAVSIVVYLFSYGATVPIFYFLCGILGFANGYWAVFMTVASEQFGVNLRATVTTTAPNFVRGAVVPLTLAFQGLRGQLTLLQSALVVGFLCMLMAFLALSALQETYGKDLDYLEF
jgi:MFS family permease